MKPFVKWAGGKTKLLNTLEQHLPYDFDNLKDLTYIEPFVGGGAMMFYMLRNHHNISHIIINDINKDLVGAYREIKDNPESIIAALEDISQKYLSLKLEDREHLYYQIRDDFNNMTMSLTRIVYFLFINHTCFNGLYRVNRTGKFNVPHGKYKNPPICDCKNILSVSKALKNVDITEGQYTSVFDIIDDNLKNVFYYLDPPYRPSSQNGQSGQMFTEYNKQLFDDSCQDALKRFCDTIHKKGWLFMLSNSDSKDDGIPYFDKLYAEYNIHRIVATKTINTYSTNQRKLEEIIITNYSSLKNN